MAKGSSKRSVGQPIGDNLDVAAVVLPADVLSARALWRKHAPGAFKGLLDAVPVERSNKAVQGQRNGALRPAAGDKDRA